MLRTGWSYDELLACPVPEYVEVVGLIAQEIQAKAGGGM
jgi:hypothetical protein